jgi:hypothetical protein
MITAFKDFLPSQALSSFPEKMASMPANLAQAIRFFGTLATD